MTAWEREAPLYGLLDFVPADHLSTNLLLRNMLDRSATPNSFHRLNLTDAERADRTVTELEAIGTIECSQDASGWSVAFTEDGLRSLVRSVPLGSPRPAIAFRGGDIPLKDRTAFELVTLLRDQGWVWQKFPKKREEKMDRT